MQYILLTAVLILTDALTVVLVLAGLIWMRHWSPVYGSTQSQKCCGELQWVNTRGSGGWGQYYNDGWVRSQTKNQSIWRNIMGNINWLRLWRCATFCQQLLSKVFHWKWSFEMLFSVALFLSIGHLPFSTADGDIVNKSILTQLTSQAVVFIPKPSPSTNCKRISKIISMLMTNKVIK